jgi:phosphoribosylanthranilate isomerase
VTSIKLCGVRTRADIAAVNVLRPDFVGFVLDETRRRSVPPETVRALRTALSPEIKVVGVFVDAPVETVAALLNDGTLDLAQLHGRENEAYLALLRERTQKPLIQAFRIEGPADLARAEASTAELLLLDGGCGTGVRFDWTLLRNFQRPYFLAGGLTPENVGAAVSALHPSGVDVSSGIETDGAKDKTKMAAFVAAVRKADREAQT